MKALLFGCLAYLPGTAKAVGQMRFLDYGLIIAHAKEKQVALKATRSSFFLLPCNLQIAA